MPSESGTVIKAVAIPAFQFDRSEYENFEETDPSQLGRGKRRTARENVDYRELDDEGDLEDESDLENVLRPTSKKRLLVSDVQRFTNQLSRPSLEKLVVDLFRSSSEFRVAYKDILKKSNLVQNGPEIPETAENPRLGRFAKVPPEIIIHLLGFLPFKDRHKMTTVVHPDFCKFRWVAGLWSEIDTNVIPYFPLLNTVLPKLGTKCIKHLTLVYKVWNLKNVEKLLRVVAKDHELKSFTLQEGSHQLTRARVDYIAKLVKSQPNFHHVENFAMKFQLCVFPGFHFNQALELCEFWPHLKTLEVDLGSPPHSFTLETFKTLARRPSLQPSARISNNFITRLTFPNPKISVESVVMVHLGTLFPELESATFYLRAFEAIRQRANTVHSCYEFVAPLPRLRYFKLAIPQHLLRTGDTENARAASMMFLSIIHQAPNLRDFTYMRYVVDTVNVEVVGHMELFCAIKDWSNWTGISNRSLEQLYLNSWALEWDLLKHNGYMFQTPNMKKAVTEDCLNIRKEDPAKLLKNGGSYQSLANSS